MRAQVLPQLLLESLVVCSGRSSATKKIRVLRSSTSFPSFQPSFRALSFAKPSSETEATITERNTSRCTPLRNVKLFATFSKFTAAAGMGSANCKTFVSSSMPRSNSSKTSKTDEEGEEVIEGVLCNVDDITDNEIKTFDFHDQKVLLVKQNGTYSALGSKCPHYGAPLTGAALGEGRIRCQWHGACFNLKTGDIEDFPGLDSLPCYHITINDSKEIVIRAKKRELESGRRTKKMEEKSDKDAQVIVAIGGGPSSACFVETLRQEGYRGRIVMISKENYNPYDRVKLSKSLDNPIQSIQLRTDDFYNENGIETMKGVSATAVDTSAKCVSLSNGDTLNYDRLYVATGSKPFKAPIEGYELNDVVTLRNVDDAKLILQKMTAEKHMIILGSSFIAMEAAAYSVGKVASVTVIGRDTVPFKAAFGEAVGKAVMNLFVEKGVLFKMESGIKRIIDEGGKVTSVELVDGTFLNADLVLMGIGSTLNTEFLADSGIELDEGKGHVPVNEFMQTNVKEVYAGGDIAFAPIWCAQKTNTIGHFPLAELHGRIAALNALGKKTPLQAVPYFWTTIFGKSIRYAGYGEYDDIVYSGNVNELKFVAFYLCKDKVVSVSSCMMDPIVSRFAELLAQGKQLYRKNLQPDPLAWANSK